MKFAKISDKAWQELKTMQANHQNRVIEAWRRAMEKHGEKYANEIFPYVNQPKEK